MLLSECQMMEQSEDESRLLALRLGAKSLFTPVAFSKRVSEVERDSFSVSLIHSRNSWCSTEFFSVLTVWGFYCRQVNQVGMI